MKVQAEETRVVKAGELDNREGGGREVAQEVGMTVERVGSLGCTKVSSS